MLNKKHKQGWIMDGHGYNIATALYACFYQTRRLSSSASSIVLLLCVSLLCNFGCTRRAPSYEIKIVNHTADTLLVSHGRPPKALSINQQAECTFHIAEGDTLSIKRKNYAATLGPFPKLSHYKWSLGTRVEWEVKEDNMFTGTIYQGISNAGSREKNWMNSGTNSQPKLMAIDGRPFQTGDKACVLDGNFAVTQRAGEENITCLNMVTGQSFSIAPGEKQWVQRGRVLSRLE